MLKVKKLVIIGGISSILSVFCLSKNIASAYVLNGTKQPNISSVAWREDFVFRNLYTSFITAKNDWDATPTRVGFAMNTTSPQVKALDYSSADGYIGRTYIDNTKPEIMYLNWYYLGADTTNAPNKVRSTAGHEWGHALGLEHGANPAIMNPTRDRSIIYVPQTDDVNGIKALYP